MIKRVVLIKLDQTHANEDERDKVARHAARTLALVPGVEGIEVAVAADDKARESWDVALTVAFEQLDAYERYRDDPDHRAFVDEFLKGRGAFVKAWNFEVQEI